MKRERCSLPVSWSRSHRSPPPFRPLRPLPPRRPSPKTSRRSSTTTAPAVIGPARSRRCRCCRTTTCGRGRKAIKSKVVAREMPPWGADPDAEPQDAQRPEPVAGADRHDRRVGRCAARRRGNDADMPPAPKFAERMDARPRARSTSSRCRWSSTSPPKASSACRCSIRRCRSPRIALPRSLELRPGNRAVVHHAGMFVVDIPEGDELVERPPGRRRRQGDRRSRVGWPAAHDGMGLPGSSKLLSWVPGRGVDAHRPNVGKRIPAGKYINWQVHYNPTGQAEKDRTRLGIWFNKVPVTHEVLIRQAGDPLATTKGGLVALSRRRQGGRVHAPTRAARGGAATTPNIPPYVENWELIGITPVTEAITLYAMSPHMHLRGKSLKWVVDVSGRPRAGDPQRAASSTSTGSSTTSSPSRCRFLPAARSSASASTTTRPKNRWNPAPHLPSVLVGAELGRDVSGVHRVLGGQPGPHDSEEGGGTAAVGSASFVASFGVGASRLLGSPLRGSWGRHLRWLLGKPRTGLSRQKRGRPECWTTRDSEERWPSPD